jgi:hypothetical protein
MGVWISVAKSGRGLIHMLLRMISRLFWDSYCAAVPTKEFRLPLMRSPADKTKKSDSSQSRVTSPHAQSSGQDEEVRQ